MQHEAVPTAWQVAGSAAENYERHLVPAVFATWVPHLLDAAGVDAGQAVHSHVVIARR